MLIPRHQTRNILAQSLLVGVTALSFFLTAAAPAPAAAQDPAAAETAEDAAWMAASDAYSTSLSVLMMGEVMAALEAAGPDPAGAADDLNYILARYQSQADALAEAQAAQIQAELDQTTDPEQRASLSTAGVVLIEMIRGMPRTIVFKADEFANATEDLSGDPQGRATLDLINRSRAFGGQLNTLRAAVRAGGDTNALVEALQPQADAFADEAPAMMTALKDDIAPATVQSIVDQIRAAPAAVALQAQGPTPAGSAGLEVVFRIETAKLTDIFSAVALAMEEARGDRARLDAIVAQRQPEVDAVLQRVRSLVARWAAAAPDEAERASRQDALAELGQIGDLNRLRDAYLAPAQPD